jgi:hypothetical protein
MAHGGKRPNSGRKPKKDELSMVEAMDKYDPDGKVWGILWNLVKTGDSAAIKLWTAYRYGSPIQTVNQNTSGGLLVTYETDAADNTFDETASSATGYSSKQK